MGDCPCYVGRHDSLDSPDGARGPAAPPAPQGRPAPEPEGGRAQKRARPSRTLLAELKDLAALRTQGAVTDEEFKQLKERLLREG